MGFMIVSKLVQLGCEKGNNTCVLPLTALN